MLATAGRVCCAHGPSAQRGMSCRTEKKIAVLRKYNLSLLVIIFLENVCLFTRFSEGCAVWGVCVAGVWQTG